MIEKLVSRVFATRNAAHLAHWSETSGYRHGVLGEFYEDVIDKVDSLVEAYQGVFELIKVKKLEQAEDDDMVSLLESDLEWINENRGKITEGLQALDNLLQDLEAVYMHTLYKLRNLK